MEFPSPLGLFVSEKLRRNIELGFWRMSTPARRKQLSTRREGSEQTNAFCVNFKNIAAEGVYPSENIINSFLVTHLDVVSGNCIVSPIQR